MKYVVVDFEGEEQIFTFPRSIDHDRFFEGVGAIRMGSSSNWKREYRLAEAVSAGFVDCGECHGHSETLKLKSRGDVDTALLRKML